CPACAEVGQDRKGEHLRISHDGKFGCCVFPGERKHRSRIFALAGEHGPKAIKVRVTAAKTAEPMQLDLLGPLGRMFSSPSESQVSESVISGTLGTPTYSLSHKEKENPISKLIDNRTSVPSVPVLPGRGNVQLPYLTSSGDLVIPFDSPERYHWW